MHKKTQKHIHGIELDPIIQRFHARIKHFGAQPSAVLWGDGELQIKRFQTLIELIANEKSNTSLSIADFGCGYGAFFTFLKNNSMMKNRSFTGYDITEAMITSCRENINDARAHFIHDSKMHSPADYVFVSGTFSLRCATEHNPWEEMVKSSLLHLWKNARKGLAFNLLSDSNPNKDPELYYANSEDYRKYCYENMSQKLKLVDGPVLNEFTILVCR